MSIRAGGGAAPTAHHWATMPPQASIARRTTQPAAGASSPAGFAGPGIAVGLAPSERSALHTSSPPQVSSAAVQQEGCAAWVAQHDA